MDKYTNYKNLFCDIQHPQLFLNLNSLDSNMKWVHQNANSKKIRIATKSIRSTGILRYVINQLPNVNGLMSYTLAEALWLRSQGFKNILMGYPTMDQESLKTLCNDPSEITLMIDDIEQLKVVKNTSNQKIKICLDIDLSLDLPFLRFGVYRSPLNTTQKIKNLVQYIKNHTQFELVGFMGYEAQIAGIGDRGKPLIQLLKKISIAKVRKKRKKIFDYLVSQGFSLSIINGGGTGSLLNTSQEDVVSEITIGSAFYAPTLFDQYRDFSLEPAMFYSAPIVRKPLPNTYTCLGGGYIASGSIEKSKQPTPYLPSNVKLYAFEGAGEVQTPVQYTGDIKLNLGDPIFFRYAKAGELCERFNEIVCFRDQTVNDRLFTYRGEGKSFS